MEKPPKKLLEQVSDVIRLKHYSYKTEKSYVNWIKRYIIFHNKRHPKEMSGKEIEEFLTHLAVEENVAASTQNQALNAILFLYKEVLKQELDLQVDAVRCENIKMLIAHAPASLSTQCQASPDREWIWQFVFPSDRISQDPRSKIVRRHL